jgi:hypothetical protein
MTDKEIDEFLKKFTEEKQYVVSYKDYSNEYLSDETKKDMFNLEMDVTYLKDELKVVNFMKSNGRADFFYLTQKGRKIIRLGGWFEYLNREEEIEKKREEKENFDLKISKLQAKTGWFPYLFSIIGIGISIYALNTSNKKTHNKQSEKVHITKESNLLKYKDYPTKDSLNRKGKGIDSLNLSNQ